MQLKDICNKKSRGGFMKKTLFQRKLLVFTLIFLVSYLIAYFVFKGADIQTSGDDQWFRNVAHTMGIRNFLEIRYHTWSGRLPVEAAMILFLRLPIEFWHVLGALSIVLMGWATSRICDNVLQKSGSFNNIIIYFISFLLPFFVWISSDSRFTSLYSYDLLNGATNAAVFWYSGYFNYFLPLVLTFTMIALFLDMERRNKQQQLWYVIPIVIAGFYATSVEQTAFLWAAFCFMMFTKAVWKFYILKKEGKSPSFFNVLVKQPQNVIYILTGIFTLFFLTVPGNRVRLELEITKWLPEFSNFTVFEKIQLGIGFGFEKIGHHMSLLILGLFLIFIILMVLHQKKYGLLLALSGFLFSVILFSISQSSNWSLFHLTITTNGVEMHWSIKNLLLVIIVLVHIALFILCYFDKGKMYTIFFFCLSIVSSIVIGFSPTVYGSGIRTQYLSFVLLGVVFVIALIDVIFLMKTRVKEWN